MKKLFVASVIAAVLGTSTAFAFGGPSTRPAKGTEGPDIRYAAVQPIRGIEGPDVRATQDERSGRPVVAKGDDERRMQ